MAHIRQPDPPVHAFEDDSQLDEASSPGTIALSPVDSTQQATLCTRSFQTNTNGECVDGEVEPAHPSPSSAPDGDDELPEYLKTLEEGHEDDEEATEYESSIDDAVMAAITATGISRDDTRELAEVLEYRYNESGSEEHLDAAISIMQHVADAEGAEDRYGALESLLRFQKLSLENTLDAQRLDEAISTANLLLEEGDVTERVELLQSLCDLYKMRLEDCQTVENLDKCIAVCRDIMKATPTEDDGKYTMMHNISVYYTRRYSQSGCLEDLRQAVEFDQMAIGSTDFTLVETRTSLLEGLVQSFMLWYEKERQFPILDENILNHYVDGYEAGAQNIPEKAAWLFMLSRNLEDKVRDVEPSQDALDDLELSIILVLEALEAYCRYHYSNLPSNFEDLVDILRRKQRLWSERTGKIPDTPEFASVIFPNGSRWNTTEFDNYADPIITPFYMVIDSSDATGDGAGKQGIALFSATLPEVNKDQKETVIRM